MIARIIPVLLLLSCGGTINGPPPDDADVPADTMVEAPDSGDDGGLTCGAPGLDCCPGQVDGDVCGYGFGVCVQHPRWVACEFCGLPGTWCCPDGSCSFPELTCQRRFVCEDFSCWTVGVCTLVEGG